MRSFDANCTSHTHTHTRAHTHTYTPTRTRTRFCHRRMRFHPLGVSLILSSLLVLHAIRFGRCSLEVEVTDEAQFRVAFGSCNFADRPQPVWEHVNQFNPDAWVWLGDVVYADRRYENGTWEAMSPAMRRAQFDAQARQHQYAQFRRNGTRILGVWDDHDYAHNAAKGDYPYKDQSQGIFLDFLHVPKESMQRNRKGLYQSHTFGEDPNERVKLIILDTRYHQSPSGETLLGEEQWNWLRDELNPSNVDWALTIIASSMPVLCVERGMKEDWAKFPNERKRLMDMCDELALPTILISGDVHMGEIVATQTCMEGETRRKAFYEVTSSGLTHTCDEHIPWYLPSCHWWYTWVFGTYDRVGRLVTEMNWGALVVDWRHSRVDLSVRSVSTGETLNSLRINPWTSNGGEEPVPQCRGRWIHPWKTWDKQTWKRTIWYSTVPPCIMMCITLLGILVYVCMVRPSPDGKKKVE